MDSLLSAPLFVLSRVDAARLLRVARRFDERPGEMRTVLRTGRLDLGPEENEALLRAGARDLIAELDAVLGGQDSLVVGMPHIEAVLVAILEAIRDEDGTLNENLQRLREECDVQVVERSSL